MGKYIAATVVVLVVLGGVFVLGIAAGISGGGGRVCEMTEVPEEAEQVCIVDGVTYAPVKEAESNG